MNTFVQLVVNGLGKGAVYALLALGFVIIFKATEVVNFAHGSLVLIGGYAVYELQGRRSGWAAAAAVGIARRGARRAADRAGAARATPATPTTTASRCSRSAST